MSPMDTGDIELCGWGYDPGDAFAQPDATFVEPAQAEAELWAAIARAESEAARDAAAYQRNTDAMFVRALRDPAITRLIHLRALLVIGRDVASVRSAAFLALLNALRQLWRRVGQIDLARRARAPAMQRVLPAATPSGRALPTDCLTPRLVAQRPAMARAPRAPMR